MAAREPWIHISPSLIMPDRGRSEKFKKNVYT